MQTFDLVVTHPGTGGLWRASRQRKLFAIASLAAFVAGGAAWLERPAADSAIAARPKLDSRISVVPEQTPTDDDVRMAAFQQAVARSFLKSFAATSVGEVDPHSDAAASKAAHPRVRPVATAAKTDAPTVTPLPPPRPVAPEVIVADIPAVLAPPPPAADPGYVGASLRVAGDVAHSVVVLPDQARDLAAATVDRVGGTLSGIRAGIGL